MLSGRVASVDLSGHPDAVQGARELLRMNAATRIDYAEPVQAFAGDEYDEPRRRRTELTAVQLDGIACVVCGAERAPQVPAGHGPRGQLFRCVSHSDHEEAPGAGGNQPEGEKTEPTNQIQKERS
ncbi:MAG: hypothetical protein WBA87_07920 [Microbacterium sp.]